MKFDTTVFGPQHGVAKEGLTGPTTARLDSSWVGPVPGEATRLCDHIRRAVDIASACPSALLIFSGADTQTGEKGEVLGRSEAISAFEIARDHNWFGHPEVAERCHCDIESRDSAQNAAFSAFLFRHLTGALPKRMIGVGWSFKGTRYSTCAAGLPFLENGIEYVGVNDPPRQNIEAALAGEMNKLRKIIDAKDWLLDAAEWAAQRQSRNPLNRQHPYGEDIARFLRGAKQ